MYNDCANDVSGLSHVEKSAYRKYRVVVGCMVSLAVLLGSLLLHGAVKAIRNTRSAFIALYALGFCVVLAIPLLIWNSYEYLRHIDRKEKAAAMDFLDGSMEQIEPITELENEDTQKDTAECDTKVEEVLLYPEVVDERTRLL